MRSIKETRARYGVLLRAAEQWCKELTAYTLSWKAYSSVPPIIAWFIRPHMFWTVNIVTEWFRSHESSFNGSSAVNYLYSDLHLMGISDNLKVTFHSAIENSPKRQFQHMAPTRPNRLPMLLMVTTICNNEMPKFTRSTSIITKPFSKSFSLVIISLSNFLN